MKPNRAELVSVSSNTSASLLRDQFENHVSEAFLRTVVHGDRPVDAARDLGVSVATVYRSRFRVLAQLRTELKDF